MFCALFMVALGTLAIAESPQSPYQVSIGPGSKSAGDSLEQMATIRTVQYGIPLTQYAKFANSIANKTGQWTTNSIQHDTTLVDATYHTIVRPNVDTLYSESIIDLSGGDVIATMPTVQGRFFVWPFYDVYGDNFCNIGTTKNSRAGKYLVKYRQFEPGCVALESGGNYAGIIYMPTPYGAALLRIEVDNKTDADYVVASVQPGFTLEPRTAGGRIAPPLTRGLLNDGMDHDDIPRYIMQLTARIAYYNKPEEAKDVVFIESMLQLAGIRLLELSYRKPPGVNLTSAFLAARDRVVVDTAPLFTSFGNGWSALPPAVSGDFHSNYSVRAFIALNGYMQLNTTEALYQSYSLTQQLYSDQAYKVEFYGKPQVAAFWSLTVYNEDSFLVPNILGRHSLNNRGDMTYPDSGDLVRDTPANSTAPFYMLLQSTDHRPSSDWESNWLPTPAGRQPFKILMRFYGPMDSLFNGAYTYPSITDGFDSTFVWTVCGLEIFVDNLGALAAIARLSLSALAHYLLLTHTTLDTQGVANLRAHLGSGHVMDSSTRLCVPLRHPRIWGLRVAIDEDLFSSPRARCRGPVFFSLPCFLLGTPRSPTLRQERLRPSSE
ncbi:hypothetical protein B0H19DRAFT_1380044 [Mycena capillaripes]|nr:hypothetical protein B0H19DRAFT_1380044 [Mycena capillaripes]